MATAKPQCDPCQRRGTRNNATSFCTDCDEPLCSSCSDVHLSMKMLSNHHLVDVDVSSTEGFNIDRNCEKHPNMSLDFFCTRHDEVCCRGCLASNHKSCDSVIPIDLAAKNVKKSALFDSVSDDLRNIEVAVDSFLETKLSHKKKIMEKKSSIKNQIANLKQKVLKRITDLEAKLISEVDATFQTLESQSTDKEKLVTDREVDALKSQWSILTEHGSDIQIFVFLHTAKLKLPKLVDDLNGVIKKQKFENLEFTKENGWFDLSSLDKVTVVDDTEKINNNLIKPKSAQTFASATENLKELLLERKITCSAFTGSFITGIGVTRNGLIVLCDYNSTHLILISADGKHQQNIDLPGNPWNIAVDKESDTAYITIPNEKSVGIVNLKTRKFVRKFPCPGKVRGITTMRDGLAIGGVGSIYLCDYQGNNTQIIKVGKRDIYYLCLHSNFFFCCESDDGMVHKVGRNGNIIFSQKVTGMTGPIDITTDKAGLLYIVDWKTHMLVRLNQDGSVKDVLLEGNSFKEPRALAFNTDYTKLYVSNRVTKEILVFSCRY